MDLLQPHHLGALRDKPDERDHRFRPDSTALPASVNLRGYCKTVYNQLALKSCSANATASALSMTASITKRPIEPPSRLFLYYNARVIAGTPDQDSGVPMRDAIKAAVKAGTCPEAYWPYDPAKVLDRPSAIAYGAATIHAVSYQRIDRDVAALKACLAQGFPFVFGIDIYDDALQAVNRTASLPLPGPNATLFGGHAVTAVGYDDATSMFAILNSLGPQWGAHGFFTMPYAYFAEPKYTYDFWTIRAVD
jgi:C1A family cysteine protease